MRPRRSACAPTPGARRRRNPAGSMIAPSARSPAIPFRLEVRCDGASVALVSQTAGAAKAPFTAQARRDPGGRADLRSETLIAEFTAPATIADRGQPPSLRVNWSKAAAAWSACRRCRSAPRSCSTIPRSTASTGSVQMPLARAKHVELHGRLAEGSPTDNPVIETVLQIAGGSVQGVHPLLAAAVRCRHPRQTDRAEGFFAKALAGAVPRDRRPRAARSRSCSRGSSRAR